MIPFAKERINYPDPRNTLDDGLVMVGGPLNTKTLLEAYSFGIFPWPAEGYPLLWFSPPRRGILEFKRLHVPRSFEKWRKKQTYIVRADTAFEKVIKACMAQPRHGQAGTWITPEMVDAYIQFHKDGYAHSIECWRENRLVGGLYGVYVAGVFAGESMFFVEPNTSKLCLWWLIERLKEQGHQWMDIQMVTRNLEQWGGTYISRIDFLRRLETAKRNWKPLGLTLQI